MSGAPQPSGARWLTPLGVGLAAGAPWLPGAAGPGDAFVALGLSGVLLPACAGLAALGRVAWWRAGLAASGAWTAAFAIAALGGVRPLDASATWLGLWALWSGWALAGAGSALLVASPRSGKSSAGQQDRGSATGCAVALAWVAAGALWTGLPVRAERAGAGPDVPAGWAQAAPERAARLLDASPATWAFEVAGVDWMRHPAIYEPAGTDWFSGSRAPWSAGVAGLLALVLGCTFGGCCAVVRHRSESRMQASA